MPRIDAVVECPLHDSFRVRQVTGMFDLPLDISVRESFSVEIPAASEDWRIGAIVGPSGSGKTTVARAAFADAMHGAGAWPTDRAVIDAFGDHSTRHITKLLTAVGFSSPPCWLRPFHVLSGGEQFRCELARALLSPGELAVFDEFTSVVDRPAAKIGAAAAAKAIRGGRVDKKFVAVSCHYDVLSWLEPDWHLDMADGRLHRRRLRRDRIELKLFRCKKSMWRLFKRYHYLNTELAPPSLCYVALWNDRPVAFCAVLPLFGAKRRRRISRLVVAPDFQGVGVGRHVLDAVASIFRAQRQRVNLTTSHPAMIAALKHSGAWRLVSVAPCGRRKGSKFRNPTGVVYRDSSNRAVASFEYIGAAAGATARAAAPLETRVAGAEPKAKPPGS